MKIIKYIQLLDYLIKEEDSSPKLAFHTIKKIRQLPKELKSAVWDILAGRTPNLEYHGVSLNDLVTDDRMKPIRAILMLDWIRREPAVAMRYMETERYRASQIITESDMILLQKALDKLNAKGSHETTVEEDKSDIIFNDK